MEANDSDSKNIHEQGTRNDIEMEEEMQSNLGNDASQKIPYPARVFFILANEFCERFAFYGLVAVLTLYLKNKLGYSENDATVIFHGFGFLLYFLTIFGSILSDAVLGKFRTIFYLSIVYATGSVMVSMSAIPNVHISPKTALFGGLVLIVIGSGGIKPCISAFGGDQFKLPEQTAQVATFFSMFFLSNKFGAALSTAITPILRENVHCYGQNDCFPLAFGLPAASMILYIVIFLMGTTSYTVVNVSSKNMVVQVSKCVWSAIKKKLFDHRKNPEKSLLDYSVDKYGESLVNDIRMLLRIVVLYLPLPLFWALFEQKESRWTFQAVQMNGDVGFYTIKPDQMEITNPLLVLALIPVFEHVIYPILSKIGIKRPLQRITVGGVLAAISFLLSASVQFKIESSEPHSVSILWQLPQYFALTMGEIMLVPTGFAFSYEQAPESMKSVVQALFLLTISIGNLITAIFVADSNKFESITNDFLLFAGVMIVDMLVFATLASNYKNRAQIAENPIDKKTVKFETVLENVNE